MQCGTSCWQPRKAKQLTGTILTTKNLRLQTEYMGTRRTKVSVHEVPVDIKEDRMAAIFDKYGEVEEMLSVFSKAGFSTGDIVLEVSLTRKTFADILNVLIIWMLVVVEGRLPYCWSCGPAGHTATACLGKYVTPQPRTTTAKATLVEESGKRWWPRDESLQQTPRLSRRMSYRNSNNHPRSRWRSNQENGLNNRNRLNIS